MLLSDTQRCGVTVPVQNATSAGRLYCYNSIILNDHSNGDKVQNEFWSPLLSASWQMMYVWAMMPSQSETWGRSGFEDLLNGRDALQCFVWGLSGSRRRGGWKDGFDTKIDENKIHF